MKTDLSGFSASLADFWVDFEGFSDLAGFLALTGRATGLLMAAVAGVTVVSAVAGLVLSALFGLVSELELLDLAEILVMFVFECFGLFDI